MNEESLFKKLWENPRTKAGLKLVFWLLGIFIIVLILSLLPSPKQEEKSSDNSQQKEIITYQTMQKNLLKNNYEYYYDIDTNNVIYKFHGKKDGQKEIGIKESQTNTIKYYLDGITTYQVNLQELTEISDLYEIINQDFINPEYIFNVINDLKCEVSNNKYTYQTMINGKTYIIEIITDIENITNINIVTELESYKLQFLKHNNISITSHTDSL